MPHVEPLLRELGTDRLARACGRRREHRNRPLDGLGRTRSQLRLEHRRIRELADRGDRPARADDEHEIGDEDAVRVQVAGRDLGRLASAHDEHALARVDRRKRRAAPLEDDQVRRALGSERCTLPDVGGERRPGKPAARAAATHGDDARERGVLQVVRGGVATAPREREQVLERRRRLGHLGVRRSTAAHRHDDDVVALGQHARRVRPDRGLANALAGADDPDRRQVERLEHRWVEAEVRTDVREPERQGAACEAKAVGWAEHGLVGEVDHDLRIVLQRRGQRVDERHAVVLAAAELLAPADEMSRNELVRQLLEGVRDRREIVLAVDDRERARHGAAVMSGS